MKNSESKRSFSVRRCGKGRYEVRIVQPDFIGLLSVLTGLFASNGIGIESGKIETLKKTAKDVFRVQSRTLPDWKQLESDLNYYVDQALAGEIREVHRQINARLIDYLRTHREIYSEKLYPVELRIDQKGASLGTLIDITAQDTPAFLYELTNALSLLEINIVRMKVHTPKKMVHDRLWVTGADGEKITSKSKLRALQWAVLLMKQFTHLLPRVPEPARALEGIVNFGKDIFERDDFEAILLTLKESRALGDLGKVLGTSVFLWEEFIRLQHEPILQILGDQKLLGVRKAKEDLRRELSRLVKARETFGEKIDVLNEFKDREMFRVDLRHLLGRKSYLVSFADEFADLVEVVVEAAHAMAWDETVEKYSRPMISETEKSRDAVFGLGKFGGREMGYASDVELLFIYTDPPDTSGAQAQHNQKFYGEFVRIFSSIIRARDEGVFEIDLRLRPYGKDGPLAVPLELFGNYYSSTGDAWNFERQALVKLRPVLGDEKLCEEVLRIRDEFVYGRKPFDFREARDLRARQRKELVAKGTLNAKYSAGGLLDVEYLVQTLQVIYGRAHRGDARASNTLKAVEGLQRAGVLEVKVASELKRCYSFLRNLINALRIYRGNAKDLTIPPWDSREFLILGRRMGYSGGDEAVSRKFRRDCERHMKNSEAFYREWIGALEAKEKELLRRERAIPAEIPRVDFSELLSDDVPFKTKRVLHEAGFQNVPDFLARLRRLCPPEGGEFSRSFLKVMNVSQPLWGRIGDPDLAFNHLERFAESRPEGPALWERLLQAKGAMNILLTLFGSSPYLSRILISNPEYWEWVKDERKFSAEAAGRVLAEEKTKNHDPDQLRKIRHRETLRIALADLCGISPLGLVFRAFSNLADFVLGAAFQQCFRTKDVCVLGFGKLGGTELNFSSDVDLAFVGEESGDGADLAGEIREFVNFLEEGGPDSFLYRTDLRLRPNGEAGSLFLNWRDAAEYYQKRAEVWEYQALIKVRPVAGKIAAGENLLKMLEPLIFRKKWAPREIDSMREIKRRYEAVTRDRGEEAINVKMGPGGIRDIEFTVQFLQLLHGWTSAHLRSRNTFKAIEAIKAKGYLKEKICNFLSDRYVFLRRIENRLQLYENAQVFNIPQDRAGLRVLAKSLGFFPTRAESAESRFQREFSESKEKCREIFEEIYFRDR